METKENNDSNFLDRYSSSIQNGKVLKFFMLSFHSLSPNQKSLSNLFSASVIGNYLLFHQIKTFPYTLD